MSERPPTESRPMETEASSSELLILPDGRILVHNLTRTMATVLHELNPDEDTIRLRVAPELNRLAAASQRIV